MFQTLLLAVAVRPTRSGLSRGSLISRLIG